ncbi:MAG: T9SS type A sorting domain-containing protein [Bacteroidota bacterium]
MKRLLLLITFLITFFGYSQFNENAPWIANDPDAKKGLKTINEQVDLFTNYWETRDKDKKGSGYKPFMRWEYHWKNNTNPQGYIITPQEMWNAYYEKKNRVSNRTTNSVNSVLTPVSNWQAVGPFTHTNTGSWSSGQGRVNVVYQDPTNANTIYIGTPAGGIWKSTNSGDSWIPLSDNLPQIGVSGIAVDHTNSNIIYIATGDCDASDTYSIGVMKSTDGGLTWNTTGLTFTTTNRFAGDILINPSDPNMLWCATNVGIYRSLNAGLSWTVEQTGDFSQGRIRLKPGDPNTVYAVSNNRFYRSTNAGDTFTIVTTGLPTNSGRMIMDVTEANANYIYILSSTTTNTMQGVYRSTDGGTNWTKTSGTTSTFESTQSWYDLAFAVSPTNANEIYTGCMNIWKSTNGGTNFTKLNNWNAPTSQAYTHADIHYLRFFGNKLYCGSDGGVYVSENNGTTFTDKTSSAQISQFYKIAVSKQTASKMVGGLQDNGGHAYSNSIWKNYYGADGMDTAIDPNNSNLYYGFIQSGGTLYVSNNAGNSLATSIPKPEGETGNWVTPLVSNSAGELFAGYNDLYMLTDGAWVQQNINAISSGRLELVVVDPSNDNNMFVVDGPNLFKSTDKGITFTNVYSADSNITSVNVHSSIGTTIYITTSGTFGEALKSVDGGSLFTSFSEGLPDIAKNVIVHQGRNTTNPLFLGTYLGVYYRDDTMTQWEPFDTNLPNVEVTDLEINLEESILVAATYGRGIWQTAIPFQIPSDDIKMNGILSPTATNVNCDTTVSPQIEVKNNGLNPITAITFNYSYNTNNNTFNWTGLINPGQTATINLPQSTLNKGAYTFIVTSTILNDLFNDNNTATGAFFLNDSGTVNVTNTFENPVDELLDNNEGSATGIWIRGIRTGGMLATPTNNVYTTSLSGEYPNMTKAFLISECYDLTQLANPQISFKMAFDLENNWDIVYVQYSTDFGQNWEVLGEQGPAWYNSDRTPDTSGTDCNNCVGAQWTGTDSILQTYSYPLTNFNAEQNIIFRIVFHSDEGVTNEGVVVDDFLISGTLATDSFDLNTLSIYPNPSNGIFTINSGNFPIEKIEVYDVTGKIINVENNVQMSNNSSVLDLTHVATGLYFVRITSNNQKTVKRILKK